MTAAPARWDDAWLVPNPEDDREHGVLVRIGTSWYLICPAGLTWYPREVEEDCSQPGCDFLETVHREAVRIAAELGTACDSPPTPPGVTEGRCDHPDRKHTVWWWVEDGDPVPVPRSATLDSRAEALAYVADALADPPVHLRWVRVFRADNEAYECWRWDNPVPMPATPAPPPRPIPAVRPGLWRRLTRRG